MTWYSLALEIGTLMTLTERVVLTFLEEWYSYDINLRISAFKLLTEAVVLLRH